MLVVRVHFYFYFARAKRTWYVCAYVCRCDTPQITQIRRDCLHAKFILCKVMCARVLRRTLDGADLYWFHYIVFANNIEVDRQMHT